MIRNRFIILIKSAQCVKNTYLGEKTNGSWRVTFCDKHISFRSWTPHFFVKKLILFCLEQFAFCDKLSVSHLEYFSFYYKLPGFLINISHFMKNSFVSCLGHLEFCNNLIYFMHFWIWQDLKWLNVWASTWNIYRPITIVLWHTTTKTHFSRCEYFNFNYLQRLSTFSTKLQR